MIEDAMIENDMIEDAIDKTAGEIAEKLRGRQDAAALLRRLADGISERLLENTATDYISAPNAVLEVVDAGSLRLYRRYLELEYEENDNGIRLTGEDLAGKGVSVVFLSETALQKMNDLRGAGADSPRCKDGS
jgi:hypothetical protein